MSFESSDRLIQARNAFLFFFIKGNRTISKEILYDEGQVAIIHIFLNLEEIRKTLHITMFYPAPSVILFAVLNLL